MYDELVKWLRGCGNDSVGCGDCPYKVGYWDGNCLNGLLTKAADAIEELSRENESLAKTVQEASEALRKKRPVVRGKWIQTTQPLGWRDEECAECSACGEDFVLDEWAMDDFTNLMHFCPNCGADMREADNEKA